MSVWQTLRSLDEVDVIYVFASPLCNVGTVLLLVLIVLSVVRCLRCRKIAGPIILKVRPTKLQAVALILSAATLILVLCAMMVLCRTLTATVIASDLDSFLYSIAEQLTSILLPMLVFLLLIYCFCWPLVSCYSFTLFVRSSSASTG